jgi:hypothetical protein
MARDTDPRYIDILRSNFSVSNDPEYLASYIEEGGEITDAMRGFLAKLIRDRAPKRRGKSKPLSDNLFYQEVEAWRTSQENAPIYQHINKNMSKITTLEAIRAFGEIPKNKRPSLQNAFKHFATKLHFSDIKYIEDAKIAKIDGIDDDTYIDEGTLRKRYERGRDIEKKRI